MGEMFKVKIRRIGTSAGVLIPKEVLDEQNLKIGDEVEVGLVLPLEKRRELLKKAFGIAKGAKPFEREYEEDRV
jgi:antitoxin component of MazEF toxin-antitoxin module